MVHIASSVERGHLALAVKCQARRGQTKNKERKSGHKVFQTMSGEIALPVVRGTCSLMPDWRNARQESNASVFAS